MATEHVRWFNRSWLGEGILEWWPLLIQSSQPICAPTVLVEDEVVLDSKDDRTQVYPPEKCICYRTCIAACPKARCNRLSERSSQRTDRKRLHRNEEERVRLLLQLRSSRLPSGALEVRIRVLAETDESYQHAALKYMTVNEKLVHCGLCAEVLPSIMR
jgi:4Fe-4S ferredoxin